MDRFEVMRRLSAQRASEEADRQKGLVALERPRVGPGRPFYWSDEDLATLVRLVGEQMPTSRIARALGRTSKAVRNKASALGLALTAYDQRRRAPRLRRAAGEQESKRTAATRRTVRMTVDFDLSALTAEERRLLMERLQAMEPPGEFVIPKAYDPEVRRSARAEQRKAARAALGWDKPAPEPGQPEGMSRRGLRRLRSAARLAGWDGTYVPGATIPRDALPEVARYLEALRQAQRKPQDVRREKEFGEE